MNIDLVNISDEKIETSAENSVENKGAAIMYLHNYGNKDQVIQLDDIRPWIEEDFDD